MVPSWGMRQIPGHRFPLAMQHGHRFPLAIQHLQSQISAQSCSLLEIPVVVVGQFPSLRGSKPALLEVWAAHCLVEQILFIACREHNMLRLNRASHRSQGLGSFGGHTPKSRDAETVRDAGSS
eukprot:SAG31_NODE_17970_length_651_cov_1.056159_2_plen_122_part_01